MMQKTYACYWLWDKFHGLYGQHFPLSAERTFRSNDSEITINSKNLAKACQKLYIPFSMLAAHVQNVEFISDISKIEPAFFDIETDREGNFVLGFVNEKKFTDQKSFIKELYNHQLLAGFNCFRFDLHQLRKNNPQEFLYASEKNFSVSILKNRLVIDLLWLYQLFKPSRESHSLTRLGIDCGFSEKRKTIEGNKSDKCIQDIVIMKQAWEWMQAPKLWEFICSFINMDRYMMQSIQWDRFKRYIFIDHLLKEGFLPQKLPAWNEQEQAESQALFCRPGFHEDVKYWDLENAYPNSAVAINATIYNHGDFARLMQRLLDAKKQYPQFAKAIKGLANHSIGMMYDRTNYIRNEKMRNEIIRHTADKIRELANDKAVFINTDCIAGTGIDYSPVGNMKLKHDLAWMQIYNVHKWIGYCKLHNEMHQKGIRLSLRMQLFDDFISFMLNELEKNPKLFMKPEAAAKKFLRKKLVQEKCKYVLFKDSEECNSFNFIDIWPKLKYGFNEIYLGKKNWNLKKPYLPRYEKEIMQIAEQFRVI